MSGPSPAAIALYKEYREVQHKYNTEAAKQYKRRNGETYEQRLLRYEFYKATGYQPLAGISWKIPSNTISLLHQLTQITNDPIYKEIKAKSAEIEEEVEKKYPITPDLRYDREKKLQDMYDNKKKSQAMMDKYFEYNTNSTTSAAASTPAVSSSTSAAATPSVSAYSLTSSAASKANEVAAPEEATATPSTPLLPKKPETKGWSFWKRGGKRSKKTRKPKKCRRRTQRR